jgi:hypothetical protein
MRQSTNNLSCQEFQAQLLNLISSSERIANHPHLQRCELCRALMADLEAIAHAARQLFLVEEPPETLWGHIESALVREEATQGR